jgi:hypothetical protein
MGTTAGGANDWSGYDNPFRDAHIAPSRIDMGYDAIGRGPIHALGPGVITEADQAWYGAIGAPYPGTYIVEKITEGPLKGRSVFTAEDVIPSVHVGQRVDMNTVIGHFTGAGSLETGFSYGTGGKTLAAHLGQSDKGEAEGDPGKYSTAVGVMFGEILHKLGAPKGTINRPVQGKVPKNIQVADIHIPGTGVDIPTSPGEVAQDAAKIVLKALFGWITPDLMERTGLVILGAFLILVGVWLLAGKQTLRMVEKGAETGAVAAAL